MINSFKKNTIYLIIFFILNLVSAVAYAQTSSTGKNKSPFPVKYTSLIDQKIILKTITLAPVYDNMTGIYSEPIQKLLIDLLQSDKVLGYSEFPNINKKFFIEKFDTEPAEVLDALVKTSSQGLLTAFITKGPRGINAKLKLFTQDQGLILIEESFQDLNTFEISKLREVFVSMYQNIKNKLPYRGYVLSRSGIDVTLNLGTINGVKLGQVLTLAQILKLNRHPKLKTLVGSEKEIIAKIKVTQVEPYLSFAQIIFEKETGVVEIGAKILPTEYISYPQPLLNSEGQVTGDTAQDLTELPALAEPTMQNTDDRNTNESNIQKSNLLDKQNSTGIITVQGVISQYKESNALVTGANPSSSNSFAPGLYAGIQYNFLKNIFVDFNTQMNLFSSENTLSGSSPLNLSYTFSKYALSVGYNYEYINEEDATDVIKLTAALGLASIKTDVSVTSPTALTSTKTDSMLLQIKGSVPLAPDYPLEIGAKVDIFISPKFSESPVNSGSANASLTSLGAFGIYTVSDNVRARFDINLLNISAAFSGTGNRSTQGVSSSIQIMNEQIGIEYLF